ncbi:MAG: RsmE family RNA methyltransferase [Deltaproteobacteria bacterium]|jgi:16S rRNA U1498 N3-methylase RsmE|nr:RsmE family RNA methyltransferase [Deltaproteobacteria bacterium]
MKLRRLLFDPSELPEGAPVPKKGDFLTLSRDEAIHGAVVLRLKRGDVVLLACRRGTAKALVADASSRRESPRLELLLLENFREDDQSVQKDPGARERPGETETRLAKSLPDLPGVQPLPDAPNLTAIPDPFPTMALSILRRPSAFEFAVEKSVELGAALFVPIAASRSVTGVLTANKLARLKKIAAEALKQSGRNLPMPILPSASLSEFLDATRKENLPDPAGRTPGMKTDLPTGTAPLFPRDGKPLFGVLLDPSGEKLPERLPKETIFLAGPEGGFDEKEKKLAEKHGFKPFRLGPKLPILRAETAALAALALYSRDV